MENAQDVGREMILQKDATRPGLGSTDMGNVSQIFPSIHPMLGIGEKKRSIINQSTQRLL